MLKRWLWRARPLEELETELCEEWKYVDEVTAKFLQLTEQHLKLSAELTLAQERVNQTKDYEEIIKALEYKQNEFIELEHQHNAKSQEILQLKAQLESQVAQCESLKGHLTQQVQNNHELNSHLNQQVADYEELKAQFAEYVEGLEVRDDLVCANSEDPGFEVAADFAISKDGSLLAENIDDLDQDIDLSAESKLWHLSIVSDHARAEGADVNLLENSDELDEDIDLSAESKLCHLSIVSDHARAEGADVNLLENIDDLDEDIDLSAESKLWHLSIVSDHARGEGSFNTSDMDHSFGQNLQMRNNALDRDERRWNLSIFSDQTRFEESDVKLPDAHDAGTRDEFVDQLLEDMDRLNAAYQEKCAELAQLEQAYVQLLSDSAEQLQ
eukprot:TRINITY_DN3668_c0_g1_i6.p1 TRINITY_DN3668_c0_g1~~TRINITY_DN3668_c0_g1_i6.p1  ORF type:complete len:385 (+),score=86.75 TRINITY_DN3668_c0_g1_i6:276-1430(+)